MKKLYIAFSVLLVLLVAGRVAAQDNSNILRHNINYHVDSVDMWGGGDATFIDFDYNLIDLCVGPGCETDPSIHEVIGSDLAGIHFDFSMFMYLNSTFSMHGFSSGYIGVDYPVQIELDFPDHYGFDHGETTPIHSTYTVQNGWALDTHFPTAGYIALDLEYGVGVNLGISVEVAGATVFEVPVIDISFPINPEFTTPVPHDSIAVLYLNAQTGEYAYPWINDSTGMPYINTGFIGNGDSLDIHIPDYFGIGITADITIPYVETEDRIEGQCLYAEGDDPWLYMNWNLLQFIRFIGNLIGQPEIEQIVNILEGQTISYELTESASIEIEYYILHASLQMTMSMVQEFSFCPTIEATLRFATPLPFYEQVPGGEVVQEGESDVITFTVNNDLYITYPCYNWDSLQVYDVTYNIRSGFRNHTYNNLAFALNLQVLHIQITFPDLGDIFGFSTMPEIRLPEIEDGYENPDDAIASSYDIVGFDMEQYRETPRTSGGRSRESFCIPTDCGALIDESIPLGNLDLDFLGVDLEWDLQFPANQYNLVFPGTWLHPLPELDIDVNSSNVICYGDNSGVIEVTAIHSSPNYTWEYSDPEGTVNTHAGPTDMINVYSGYYYVTLTDVYGCTVMGEANILEANAPLESITRADDVLCHGDATGNLYITVYGGLPPYSYLWSNGSTEQNPHGVVAGLYTVTVTDALGCEHEDQAFVDEPDAPLEIVSSNIQHISCFGLSDGAIDITVSGGTPAYTYYWSNGYAVQDLHNIPAGAYTVTVTDANGCFIIATYIVEQPEPLMLTLDVRDVRCYAENTGSIDLTVTGGTEPYSYEWSNNATTEDLSELFAGFYIVTVTDAHGCVEYALAEVRQPALPLHGDITPTDVRCYGEGNGVCDLNVFGGTPPYYYTWNTGAISEDIDHLVPGEYWVRINDENGCLAYDTVHIYQAEFPLSGYISGRDASCNGSSDGSVMFTPDGGYEPYHYEWSNGLWQQNLVNVPAGTYTVTLTDANFCHQEYSYVVGEPEPFYIQMMDDFTICSGMTTQIGVGIVSGGVAPYTIQWSNGESGMSTEVTPLETTTYYASVVDATNCSSAEMSVTVSVLDPISLEVNLLSDTLVCPGDKSAFDVRVTGGGLAPDEVYVNGELIKFPFEPIVMNDTLFNFVAYDSCRYDSVVIPIYINTFEEVPINIGANVVEGCAPLSVSFTESTPDLGQSYFWNFDDGDFENMSFARNPKHTFYNSGLFNVRLEVTSYQGCHRDTSITITVFSVPEADFRVDRANISMSSPIVNFTNYSHGGFWNLWDFGDNTTSTSSSPVHTYTMPGLYHVLLTTTSLYGCTDTAGVDIQVSNEYNIFAPTAFTPNNDEINETFRLYGTAIDPNGYMLIIYDRWGAVQFKSTNLEEEWDGTDGTRPCAAGVYTWRAYFKDMFGIDYERTGTVMLLR